MGVWNLRGNRYSSSLNELHRLDEKSTPLNIGCSKGPESNGGNIVRDIRSVMGPVEACGVVKG